MPEFGTVIFTQHFNTHPPTITINQADPHVLVNDQILNDLGESGRHYLRLEYSPVARWCEPPCDYPSHPFCWTGWLLHVDIPGHHLVYRIGKYRRDRNAWEASWPD